MNTLNDLLAKKLEERRLQGNLRSLSVNNLSVDFYSNDYLGFVHNGLLRHTSGPETQQTGSTGSRLLSGNTLQAEELEEKIAAFHGAEAALLFNSGYDANIGLLASMAGRHTTFIYDELCHASIIDGIRLSLCRNKYRFAHNNLNDLEQQLNNVKEGNIVVVTESVFSMDGDLAPLQQIAELCSRHNAALVVDEAHATGVFGPAGAGRVCQLSLQHQVAARVHTFGKALGCHGAVVLGSALLRQFLINFARSFIYTTALPPSALSAINNAYNLLMHPHFSTAPLYSIINHYHLSISKVSGAGTSPGPIQVVMASGNEHARALAARVQQAGLQVRPILSPTVPAGSERLRICLHAHNTMQQVDALTDILSS